MGGWVDGWMGGWVDGWMGGWVDGWMGGWVDGWMGGWVDGWMGGWVDGWVDGWMGGWVDGWMGGWGVGLGWVGLGWVGLGWVGLGWVGLGWVGLGWGGVGWGGVGWGGVGWGGVGWGGVGWGGVGWGGVGWGGVGWGGVGWGGVGWGGVGWGGVGWGGVGWGGVGWGGVGWVCLCVCVSLFVCGCLWVGLRVWCLALLAFGKQLLAKAPAARLEVFEYFGASGRQFGAAASTVLRNLSCQWRAFRRAPASARLQRDLASPLDFNRDEMEAMHFRHVVYRLTASCLGRQRGVFSTLTQPPDITFSPPKPPNQTRTSGSPQEAEKNLPLKKPRWPNSAFGLQVDHISAKS